MFGWRNIFVETPTMCACNVWLLSLQLWNLDMSRISFIIPFESKHFEIA